MSFPAETRSVGIWTRSMEGSWCVVCYLGKLVGAAGQHVANWRDSIMGTMRISLKQNDCFYNPWALDAWVWTQINHCNGFEIGPPNLVRLFICHDSHGPVVYTIHTFLRPSCIKQAAWGMLFSQMVSLLCSTFVNMVPFTFFPGACVRFDLITYIHHHISIMYLSIYPSIHPSIIFIPKCGPETITVTRPDVIQPFCFSLISWYFGPEER